MLKDGLDGLGRYKPLPQRRIIDRLGQTPDERGRFLLGLLGLRGSPWFAYSAANAPRIGHASLGKPISCATSPSRCANTA